MKRPGLVILACGSVLLCLALAACPLPSDVDVALVVNHRNFPLTVEVRSAEVDCQTFEPSQAGKLHDADFGESFDQTISAQSFESVGDYQEPCAVVWIKVPHTFDGVIAWPGPRETHGSYSGEPTMKWLIRNHPTFEGTRTKMAVSIPDTVYRFPRPPQGPRTQPIRDAGVDP